MLDSACVLALTKMFKRLKARDFGTPLACSSSLLMTEREAVIPGCKLYVQCNLKDGHVVEYIDL